jgi:hypothetical protein
MEIKFERGKRVQTFGGWYRHDYVLVDGVRLAGLIQVKLRNKRIESTTHFQPLSCAVLGSDWKWLHKLHREHNELSVQNGFQSLREAL